MIKSIKRSNLRGQLSGHLFDAILHGELKPGERIIEGALAKALGVAQSTLREALQQLEHQGLVSKRDRRGTFVTKLTVQDMEDIYVVRLELEPLAASLAQPRMTAKDFSQLAEMISQMRKASTRRDFVLLLKTDLKFHELIWRLSGNRSLERALSAVCPPLFGSYMIRLLSGDSFDFQKDHDEHEALLTALKKRDPQVAKQVFRDVVEVFRRQEIDNLEAYEARLERPSSTPVVDVAGVHSNYEAREETSLRARISKSTKQRQRQTR
ncbi:MAG TPA: GntR family transcriptional regulator [Terriglobia bacterium]|nr:GntR family transcriptional regulator [Terriglobia bacterium]